MSTSSFFQSGEIQLPEALARLRSHAALVRALLDELDRLAPLSARSCEAAQFPAVGEQLAEEVARLGCRMLESAAAMTGKRSRPAVGEMHPTFAKCEASVDPQASLTVRSTAR
jgi:hypothetical protein